MMMCARVTYALLISVITPIFAQNITESCVTLYERGVEAYLDNKYDECISNFENAIRKYRDYKKKLQNCRLKCRQEAELSEPLYPVDTENLLFYEKAVKNTLCIVKCKRGYKGTFVGTNINKEAEKLFEDQKPYEYLHICYFQNKEYQKATSAAFTYLVSHPDDKIMTANLKHYSSLKGVDMKEIVNFEAKDHVYLYVHGADAYEKKDWNGVMQYMEESLAAYLQAEEECRAQCEGPFDQGWYPDFIPSIANHFTYCLRCKQTCKESLNSLNGEKHEDLLPSHYHYLQIAYFKMGNLKGACAAVASYLLFYPDDETMLANKHYYGKLPKANEDYFRPRPEAVKYIQRHIYEQRIMRFIHKQFKFEDFAKEVTIQQESEYKVIMTEKQLQGSTRFVSEGLATFKECKTFIDVAKMFGRPGDGYQRRKTPNNFVESFSGLTLNRVALLVYFGLLNPKHLELFLKLTDNAKQKLEDYFNLKNLYFTYTHLVCRSPPSDTSKNRSVLFSHEIHADNCNLIDDNTCEKLPPSYTWRDYSAIVYLNSDFEGGEFIFSADVNGQYIQSEIRPKCGRMIAFSSGKENLHGVRAVKKGLRCAIGMWFTFDPKYEETERETSRKLLDL